MKRRWLPVQFAFLLVMLALVWRMLGAPIRLGEWQALDVPLWQARVLLPGRMERILLEWCCPWMGRSAQERSMQWRQQEDMALLGQRTSQPVVLQVWNAQMGEMQAMELENYVYGVVAAEMPAAYHTEALKAQAVAARTRALYQREGAGCALAQGADVCTQSGHCQAFVSAEELASRWGNEYSLYHQRVAQAVSSTAGERLTWEGKPILVMYHAISGGRTEDVQAVFAQPVPYLVSVESNGEENVRGFRQDTVFSLAEAAQLLDAAFPQLGVTADALQKTLVIAAHTATGRVDSLLLCNEEVEATAFRAALGLRSTWFTFTMDGETITFHQTGYGHGVGMSQAGANSMAAHGSRYDEILLHYYPGVALEK